MRARYSTGFGWVRALSTGAAVATFTAALGSGCGAPTHPPLVSDDDEGGLGTRPPSPNGEQFSDDSGAPPGCGTGPDGGVCGCVDLPVVGDPPNLYFVLDRSGSMNELNKWQTVRTVVAQVVTALGGRANFGAALFPDPRGMTSCAVGAEVMTVRVGGKSAAAAVLASSNVVASGGTPTAATLTALKARLAKLSGKTFVILATDGGPNCNAMASCTPAECIPNIERAPGCTPNQPPNCCTPPTSSAEACLDAQPSINAVADLKAAGIPTYVVGVPGSGPYADVLDRLAQAGGSARSASPFYYRVDSADASALQKALSQVAAKIVATCALPLGAAPPDAKLVNVYLDNKVVAPDPVNGWKISGATVTLLGATCERVLNGDVLDVRVIAGCPTVVF